MDNFLQSRKCPQFPISRLIEHGSRHEQFQTVLLFQIQRQMTEREKAQALSNYVAQNVKYDFAGFQRYQSGQNVYDQQTA